MTYGSSFDIIHISDEELFILTKVESEGKIMYPRFDIISGHYMSNVKDYGIWLVEHKHRVRGSWRR